MGLAHRVIPTILCRGRQLVKGEKFNAWRSVGVAAQAVRIHQMRGVDELVLLDITATAEGRGPDLGLVEELSSICFMPLAVGGGVRTLDDVKALLRAGADKVVIGTAATTELVATSSKVVGCQAIVVAIDVKDGIAMVGNGKYPICGPKQIASMYRDCLPCPAVNWAQVVEAEGAGEIMLTAMDREGTMQGYDLDLIRKVSKAVSIPVIAHGGCGSYEHMAEALDAGASAVAAGAMFQFTEQTPKGAVKYLAEKGIEVRL